MACHVNLFVIKDILMQFLFFIIGIIAAYITWKKVSASRINSGKSKLNSHIVGVLSGFLVSFLVTSIGVALFVDIPMNKPVNEAQNMPKSVPIEAVSKNSYISDKTLTAESIKSVSTQILSANIYEQYAGENKGLNNIDVHINTKMFWGGAQDWNGVALTIFDLSKSLFKRSDIGKISFVVWNDDHTLDWARIEVDRTQLPQKWEELTYLEFFSHTKPMSGSVDAEEWLTEFYSKYNSAHPSNN